MYGESRPAQICRRYNIWSNVLYHWKKQYLGGRLNNEPTEEAVERLVANSPWRKRGFEEQPVSKKRQIICLGVLRWGCRLMKLAREVVYHKSRDKNPEKMEKKADLRGKIEAIYLEFLRYGYRRVTH